MKKVSISLLFLLGLISIVSAQNPVASFSAQRLTDSTVDLKILVRIPSGGKLFSIQKKTEDDLASTLTLDTSLSQYVHAKPTEVGKLQTEQDSIIQAQTQFYTDSVAIHQVLSIPSDKDIRIKGTFGWMAKVGADFPTGDTTFSTAILPLNGTTADKVDPTKTATSTDALADSNGSPFRIFWVCFLAGLVMVFTPCVFPLIPVTVSFFLKKSESKAQGIRNALWYSISIILIYTIPTFVITAIFGQDAMYKIATSVVANILFFVIFIIFAISFFGAFELALPNSWANKADEKSSKGGLLGIFFMALTLVIVSFSCTGPIVGTLLAQVSGTSAKMAPVLGMLGLSAGLAIPFSLFAFFPSLLKSLPKSGGWLNSVKVVFGFVELALAMKFLSNVDLIYGWHLLDREIFLVIWIVLSLLAGMYLLGKIKFSHDSDLKYVSIPRLFFAIAIFCFGVYLIPGLWGAPLKSMSGLLPPTNTQDFNLNELQYKIGAAGSNKSTSNASSAVQPPKLYTDKLHDAPLGLTTYYDLDEGIAAAKILNKPIMLDFTGHSCANCRKMETEVWSNPEVLEKLRNDFVIVSLYVDENSDLPSNQVYKNKEGKEISTLADKVKDFESTKFGMLSQPLYMFMDTDQNMLSDVKYGYDSNIEKFKQHLETVKAKYEAEKK